MRIRSALLTLLCCLFIACDSGSGGDADDVAILTLAGLTGAATLCPAPALEVTSVVFPARIEEYSSNGVLIYPAMDCTVAGLTLGCNGSYTSAPNAFGQSSFQSRSFSLTFPSLEAAALSPLVIDFPFRNLGVRANGI